MPALTKERLLHHVVITVFCKAYDTQELVLAGRDALSPVPTKDLLALDREYDPDRPHTVHYRAKDVTLTVEEADSDDGRMSIYTLYFRRMHDTTVFARRLVACMSAQYKKGYEDDPASLLDADGKLSVRFDKQLLMRGKLALTQDGQCYQVKASVAAYPKTAERIEEAVRKILAAA